jgi:hypothetical protein
MENKVIDLISYQKAVKDIVDISAGYFSEDIDKNIVSTFGWITQTMGSSIYSSASVIETRLNDTIVELSDDEKLVRSAAKSRNLNIVNAKPAKITVSLLISPDDIIANGTRDGMNYTFTINKKSTLTVNDTVFSLPYNIVMKAIYRDGRYRYSANMVDSIDEYVSVYTVALQNGGIMVALILNMYQVEYVEHEHIIIDLAAFNYEGISFDYDKIFNFSVDYKDPISGEYIPLQTNYRRNNTDEKFSILYDDDTPNILKLYKSRNSVVTENSTIRLTLLETKGSLGNFDSTNTGISFSLFVDEYYNFSGMNIVADILTDSRGGKEGSTIDEIKKEMIDRKHSRNIISTTNDIKRAFSDSEDVVVFKGRGDIRLNVFNVFRVLRNGDEIVPTTTKNILLRHNDFDFEHVGSGRRVINCNNMYTLLPDSEFTCRKVTGLNAAEIKQLDEDKNKLLVMCPYMINIDRRNFLNYYINFVNTTVGFIPVSLFDTDFQVIILDLHIDRNSFSQFTPNRYTFTARGVLNTSDITIKDDVGNIIDNEKITINLIFRSSGVKVAWMPMVITDYDPATNMVWFQGVMNTNDYITDEKKLQITGGLYSANTMNPFQGTIDYRDVMVDMVTTFRKEDSTEESYDIIPMVNREVSAVFRNPVNLFNLILECGRFMSSSVNIIEPAQPGGNIRYHISEVPMIRYTYTDKYADLYKILSNVEDYLDIARRLTDNTISIKFVNTYGKSKFIFVGDEDLKNLNPKFRLKVYGMVDVGAIKKDVIAYYRSFSATDSLSFISNLVTMLENKYPEATSIEFVSIDSFDSKNQKIENKLRNYIEL